MPDKRFFVIIFDGCLKRDIIDFISYSDLSRWMQDKKDIKFKVYESDCILNWSQ